MRLFTYANSERGKATEKSGNDSIIVTFTVDRKVIGEVELYLNHDIENHGDEEDEWVLYYRRPHGDHEDADIIAQGHTKPKVK
jgi:hypothetical protein